MRREEIDYLGVQMTIKGIYSPGENEVMYDSDMAGYPGSGPEFELFDIFIGGVSCIDIFQDYQIEDIKDLVIEKIEG